MTHTTVEQNKVINIHNAIYGENKGIISIISEQGEQYARVILVKALKGLNSMLNESQKIQSAEEINGICNILISDYNFLNEVDLQLLNKWILTGKMSHKFFGAMSGYDYIQFVNEYSNKRSEYLNRTIAAEKEKKEKEKNIPKLTAKEIAEQNELAAKFLEENRQKLLEKSNKKIQEDAKREAYMMPYRIFDTWFDEQWMSLIEAGKVEDMKKQRADRFTVGWTFYNSKERKEVYAKLYENLFMEFCKTNQPLNEWEGFLKTKNLTI